MRVGPLVRHILTAAHDGGGRPGRGPLVRPRVFQRGLRGQRGRRMADIRGGKRIGAAVQPADGVHIRRHGGERRRQDRRLAAIVAAATVAAHDARCRRDDRVGSVQRSLQRSQDSQLFVRGEV